MDEKDHSEGSVWFEPGAAIWHSPRKYLAVDIQDREDDVRCLRMYADEEGESHFDDLELDSLPDSMPGGLAFRTFPGNWSGSPEPADGRLMVIILTGVVELSVSDGSARRVGPSDVVLVEDTSGKGHSARVVGDAETVQAIVELRAS